MKKPIYSFAATGKALIWLFLLLLSYSALPPRAEAGKDPKILDVTMPVAGTDYIQDFEKRNEGKKYPGLYYNFGLQEGDEIELDLKRKEGKATYNLEVQEYGSGTTITAKQKFKSLRNFKFRIPQKGIYTITIRSNHPEPSAIRLKITRHPASEATRNFKTHVNWTTRYDSVFTYAEEKVQTSTNFKPVVLADKIYKVAAQGQSGKNSRVVVPFQLPEKATHWVYWIGVGQESLKDLQAIAKTIPSGSAGSPGSTDPVTAFGLGLITQLPAENASGFIDFLFMNQAAVQSFLNNAVRKPYKFASGNAIINAYGKIMATQTPKTDDRKLYLGLENNNARSSQEVLVKIIAFLPDPKFETRRVKKLSHLEEVKVPVFGE